MKAKTIFIFIIITAITVLMMTGGCKSQDEGGEASVQEIIEEGVPVDEAAETAGEQEQEMEEETSEGSESTEEITEAEEEIEIPEEITQKIQEADSLFAEGLYAEASKEYRNAQIAAEEAGLPGDIKQGLLDSINENYVTSRDIVDTAQMHHSNAMNLIYEKRYDEAEAELLAALAIYPKYQTAVDALESLEDIKGLQ